LCNTYFGGGNFGVFRVRICIVVGDVICALNIKDRTGLSCMLSIIVMHLLDLDFFVICPVGFQLFTGFLTQQFWSLFRTVCSVVCELNIKERTGLLCMLLILYSI